MKVKKSKHDLTDVAYLKVPKAMYLILQGLAGENIHWSELARDYLGAQILFNLEMIPDE